MLQKLKPLWGKFYIKLLDIRISQFSLIEQRSTKAEPYEQALNDIYTCYCHQREQLIGPGVYSSFNDLKDGRDVCGLVRASCAFMLQVSQDEYQLFRHFFNNTTPILDDMLQRLCQVSCTIFLNAFWPVILGSVRFTPSLYNFDLPFGNPIGTLLNSKTWNAWWSYSIQSKWTKSQVYKKSTLKTFDWGWWGLRCTFYGVKRGFLYPMIFGVNQLGRNVYIFTCK